MNFIICWIKDFIKSKWLFLLGNALIILAWIFKGIGLFPENQSWYIIAVAPLIGGIFTILFCSLKEYLVLKITYYASIVILAVLIDLAILDLVGVIKLPAFLNR